MRIRILCLLLCSLSALTACDFIQGRQVKAVEEVVQPVVIKRVESVKDAPDMEAVLFKEIPNSAEAAESFLNMLRPFDLRVKHVTVKDYGKGNYSLNCTFDNSSYSIMVFVRPEDNTVKWYGSLKFNDEEVTDWKYNYT